MSQGLNYFLVSLDNVPQDPTYPVWFATWTSEGTQVEWTRERPMPMPETTSTCVACIVSGEPPPGATPLGDGSKDLPPPPSTFSAKKITSVSDFQQTLAQWLVARSPS